MIDRNVGAALGIAFRSGDIDAGSGAFAEWMRRFVREGIEMTPRALIATFVSFSVLMACSASPTTDGSTSGSGNDPVSAGATTGGSGGQGNSGTSATTGGGGNCTAQSSHSACLNCCVSQYQAGAVAYDTAFLGHCACAQGATCNSACSDAGDVCVNNSASPSQACVNCLDGLPASDACESGFHSDCEGNADCVKFVTCGAACP